jgi:hypothetical protein
MPRLTYLRAEWQAIAAELAAPRRVVPSGLLARVHALLQQVPEGWPEQLATLELDASSAEAVQAVHAALVARDPAAGAQADAVAEAVAIIQAHQRRAD